jgi:hypothetical protein
LRATLDAIRWRKRPLRPNARYECTETEHDRIAGRGPLGPYDGAILLRSEQQSSVAASPVHEHQP